MIFFSSADMSTLPDGAGGVSSSTVRCSTREYNVKTYENYESPSSMMKENSQSIIMADEYRQKLLEKNIALRNHLTVVKAEFAEGCKAVEVLQTKLSKNLRKNKKLKHDYHVCIRKNQLLSAALNISACCVDPPRGKSQIDDAESNDASKPCGSQYLGKSE